MPETYHKISSSGNERISDKYWLRFDLQNYNSDCAIYDYHLVTLENQTLFDLEVILKIGDQTIFKTDSEAELRALFTRDEPHYIGSCICYSNINILVYTSSNMTVSLGFTTEPELNPRSRIYDSKEQELPFSKTTCEVYDSDYGQVAMNKLRYASGWTGLAYENTNEGYRQAMKDRSHRKMQEIDDLLED